MSSRILFATIMASPSTTKDRTEESLRLLADAGTLLASTLEYNQILENLAHLVVPRLADWCIIDMVDDAGVIERFTVVPGDPDDLPLAKRLQSVDMLESGAMDGFVDVIRSGRSIFIPEVDESELESHLGDEVTRALLAQLAPVSLMIVPINAKGLLWGAVHLIATDPARRYGSSELLLAEDLGRRAGIAIDNAHHYEESRKIAEELRKANEAKDEFLGMISHELRTPITVIHGGARILRLRSDQIDEAKRDELIADIEEESDRLHRIVENLLALSRVQLEEEVSFEPVLLQRVVPQIASTFRRQRRKREIEVDVPEGFPTVAADQGYIEQVMRNLISNAVKYSPLNSPVEITVDDAGDGMARIQVLDRGQGVDEEELERIFERFYRSDAAAVTTSGAGMGLAVCRRLAEAMRGSIVANPREGGGLIMELKVPFDE